MHLITQTLDCTKSLALLVGWLAHSFHLPPLAASCVVAPAAAVDMMEGANPAQFLGELCELEMIEAAKAFGEAANAVRG